MQRQQKLLLSLMVWGGVLFWGQTVLAIPASQEIAKIALDSTVHLAVLHTKGGNTGSGFFVDSNRIATNYHVIEAILNEDAFGGAKLVGEEDIYAIKEIVGVDKEKDLAIIEVREAKGRRINVPALPLGDSDTVQIGEKIYVAGNPEGLEGTFSDGIISGIRGDSTYKVFQMTAPISQGSSGGPVLNEKGEVIGVSVATLREGQNLNFAVAVNHLEQLAKQAGIPITPTSPETSPFMKHNPPSRVSVGAQIPLVLDLISSKAPRQVTIFYKTYDKDGKELEQHNQDMRSGNKRPASSTWTYKVNLPPQRRVGSIKYYIEVEDNNRVAFRYPKKQSRYYQISIVDDKPPTISVLSPDDGEQFTADQQITFRAEVMDNSVVEEVHIYVLSPSDQSRKLSEEGSSDTYTADISFSQVGTVEYYLTATDEAGKESRSENRRLIITPSDTTPPTIRLIKPSRTTFKVDQQIPVEAKVTDGSSVKQVRLFYSFSPSRHFSHHANRALTETSSDTYAGHIPPQSKVGYIEYYLTATDEAGNDSKSESRHIEITPPPPLPPLEPERPRPAMLDKGIKLYEGARYTEAINVLNSVIQEIENPIHQAEAYLYLGGAKRGSGASNDTVKEEFRKAIRHNPNQALPYRMGEDHPIFAELLEEVRKELTGELTVISLVPQTKIWIEGDNTDKKMLGTGRVSSRLLKGSYTVEAIYAGGSQREVVTVELDHHEILYIPPIVEHTPPPSISVGERIPLRLNLISSEAPRQVTVNYKVYDRDGNELAPNNQEMHVRDGQTTSSMWVYRADLPSQKRVGLIEYYIEVEYDNQLAFRYPSAQSRYYRIPILDNKPPTISVLSPRDGERFNVGDQTAIRAEVIDNSVVKEVRVHFLPGSSQAMSEEGPPGLYAIEGIQLRHPGSVEYYLTATDEAGNESKSDPRHIDIRLVPPNKSPTIDLLDPPPDVQFTVNEQIMIRAEVTDDTAVKEVLVHFSPGDSQLMSAEGSSDIYAMDISFDQAGSVEYFLTATDEAGNESKSESRYIEIIPEEKLTKEDLTDEDRPRESTDDDKPGDSTDAEDSKESTNEDEPQDSPIYQGIWATYAWLGGIPDMISISDLVENSMFSLAYLREGKNQPTLGAQLDVFPDRSNMSAMFQWGPALGESKVAFTVLGGIATYEDSPRSTHTTPIFGGGLKFYPVDEIVIDATGSFKLRSDYDTTDLYHYEVGIRFYITSELGLRAGYGKLYLGNEDVTTLQIGLGVNF